MYICMYGEEKKKFVRNYTFTSELLVLNMDASIKMSKECISEINHNLVSARTTLYIV